MKTGSLLARSGWRHWQRHPWQAVLALAGVAMGVAMVVAVDLASQSARASYLWSTETLAGKATHHILGVDGGLPDSLYVRLRLAGLRDGKGYPLPMTPVLEARVSVEGPGAATSVDSPRERLPPGGAPADSTRGSPTPGAAAPSEDSPRDLPSLGTAPADSPRDLPSSGWTPSDPSQGRTSIRRASTGATSFRLVGVDPFSSRELNAFGLVEAGIGGGGPGGGLPALLSRPGSALMSRKAAWRLGLAAGDSLVIRSGSRPATLRILGYLEPRNRLAASLVDDILLSDLSTAQEALGRPGRLSRIELNLAGAGTSARPEAGLADSVRARLPPDALLAASNARARTLDSISRAFRINLTALSLLALLVGAFLIYNTMSFSVAQRWSLLGALRGLGAEPRDIARLVGREALVLSALGSALGLLGGVLLGRGLVVLVARTLNDLYFAAQVTGLRLDPLLLAKGAALGLLMGLLASLGPAWQASRIRPRSLLTRSAQETRLRKSLPLLNGLGLAAALASILLAARPPGETTGPGAVAGPGGLAAGFAALLLAVIAWALWTPSLLRLISAAGAGALKGISRVTGSAGTLARMALREMGASLSRTGVAAAALMAALSVTVAMGVMVDSFRHAVRAWLESILVADVYASAPRLGSGRLEGTLDPAWVEAARRLPGVAGATTYRAAVLNLPAGRTSAGVGSPPPGSGLPARASREEGASASDQVGQVQLLALDMDSRSRAAFRFLAGDSARAWAAFRSLPACGLLVSEPFAYRQGLRPGHGLRPGSHVTLPTRYGPRAFPVAAVFADYGSDQGVAMLARSCFDLHWDMPGHTSMAFFASEGLAADSLARRLASLPGSEAVEIHASRALRTASLEIFDRTFAITSVLRLAAVVVATIGLVGALAALELERAPETALLRALGLTPFQTWALAAAQSACLGLATGLLSIPLGLVQAGLLIHVINRRSFGWSMPMQVDPAFAWQALALGLGAALLAAALPAWKTARAVTARALREE